MDADLRHEDLLIKLRAKLNEEKIKLWQPPYLQPDNDITPQLQELSTRYSLCLYTDSKTVLNGLRELQLHSFDRCKANAEFNETGLATLRVKANFPDQKPQNIKVRERLDAMGSVLNSNVASELGVQANCVKLISNGRVIKPSPSLEEQGIKNGMQLMAIVMTESPEELKKQDKMYMEMKSTRDDAMLLSEDINEFAEDDEYMKLEDQSGKAVELPPAERRSLLVGLALHERGRAAAKQRDYPLALLLLLEADRQLSECSSSILKTVDNWAVLQLDIAWCYLCLRNLASASDAALRLTRAEEAFRNSYGENHQRLIALKGTAANERALIMRLYLLQGIVAYHQNRREQASKLFEKAEVELNSLRVDEGAVVALMELGWSRGQARAGLRAARNVDDAHHWLADRRQERQEAREKHRADRLRRSLGLCQDGTQVSEQLVEGLVSMGYGRRLATLALRNSNNHVAEAVRIIQEQPELLQFAGHEGSSEETESPSSEESLVSPDQNLVAELEGMGYAREQAWSALRATHNDVADAVDLLVARGGTVPTGEGAEGPSTSAGGAARGARGHGRRNNSKRKERELALQRLSSTIRTDEDDYLDVSLEEEEEFLAQYRSLL